MNFSVDGVGLTRLVRDLWEEGNPHKALNILESLDMDIQTMLDILQGKSKLVSPKKHSSGVDLVPDNYKGTSLKTLLEQITTQRDNLKTELSDLREIYSGSYYTEGSPTGPVKKANSSRNRSLNNKQIEEDEEEEIRPEPPEPMDTITSKLGWLSPEGKFYPCKYGHHAEVAYSLGLAEHSGDHSCEPAGWIRVTENHDEQWFFGAQDHMTPQKLDKIKEFCNRMSIPMPYYIVDS